MSGILQDLRLPRDYFSTCNSTEPINRPRSSWAVRHQQSTSSRPAGVAGDDFSNGLNAASGTIRSNAWPPAGTFTFRTAMCFPANPPFEWRRVIPKYTSAVVSSRLWTRMWAALSSRGGGASRDAASTTTRCKTVWLAACPRLAARRRPEVHLSRPLPQTTSHISSRGATDSARNGWDQVAVLRRGLPVGSQSRQSVGSRAPRRHSHRPTASSAPDPR